MVTHDGTKRTRRNLQILLVGLEALEEAAHTEDERMALTAAHAALGELARQLVADVDELRAAARAAMN